MRRTATREGRLAFSALAAWGVAFVFAACASRHGDAGAEHGIAKTTARDVATLARADARLAEKLAARAPGEGWEREGSVFTSPGWRAVANAKYAELGARLPASANGNFEIGIAQFANTRLTLSPEGANDAPATVVSGHVVYPRAYGDDVDLLVTTERHEVESMLLIRSAAAPHAFVWDATLPAGIARVTAKDGGLAFLDHASKTVLYMPKSYAVDAKGVVRDATVAWDVATGRIALELDTRGLAYPVLLDPSVVSDIAVWEEVQEPPALAAPLMAYDAKRGNVVVFGGSLDLQTPTNNTWTWDGTAWTRESPPTVPPARFAGSMFYDTDRNVVVMFGGSGGAPLDDTWQWDGANWTELLPANAPPARFWQGSAYDGARGRGIVFGGLDAGGHPLGDTWLWDGGTWSQASPAHTPKARAWAGLGYDAARKQTILFAGESDQELNDTWAWDGIDWTELFPPSSPSPTAQLAVAYDDRRARLVACLDGGPDMGRTVEWDGKTWTTGPAVAAGCAIAGMAYDSAHGNAVVFGGHTPTMLWDGTSWTQGSPPLASPTGSAVAMVYDGAHGVSVMVGDLSDATHGVQLAGTWTWSGRTWTEASTSAPPLSSLAMAYDAKRQNVVYFGNGQTWKWNGTTWTQLSPATSPPARAVSAMAYDEKNERIVLFGGGDGSVGLPVFASGLADTWLWDGTNWTQVMPAHSPSGRYGHAMVFEPLSQHVILHGGSAATGPSLETWAWDGADWSLVPVAHTPTPRLWGSMAADTRAERVVLFGGYGNGGALSDTWIFDGSDWAHAITPNIPPPRYGQGLTYDAAHGRVTLFGGADMSEKGLGDTWLLYVRGGSCSVNADCDTGFCTDGVCCTSPSCGSCGACNLAPNPGVCASVVNGPDPDTCAGASSCDANGACKAALGQPCGGSADCSTGFCADGVCCQAACGARCNACASALTGVPDGTCALVKSGAPHESDCVTDAPSTCLYDGTCDGEGGCRYYGTTTACGGGGSACRSGQIFGTLCDGLGHCGSSATAADCSPYTCNPATGACASPCTADEDCILGDFCDDDGKCKARLAHGAACKSAKGCPLDSPYCADGFCCNTLCTGPCEACNVDTEQGTCVPVVGAPPKGHPACTKPASDDVCAAVTCDGITHDACTGFVGITTACRDASCTAGFATAAANCTGRGACDAPAQSSCAPYVCAGTACGESCAADDDCDPKFHCNVATKLCVPRDVAMCDGMHTLRLPSGGTTDCTPFTCGGSTCKTSCVSVLDCAYPAQCDAATLTCVAPGAPTDATTRAAGGCACRAANGRTRDDLGGLAAMGAGAIFFARRRRTGKR